MLFTSLRRPPRPTNGIPSSGLEVVITIVGLALIVSSEPFHFGMLIVLVPLAFGAGLVVWGCR